MSSERNDLDQFDALWKATVRFRRVSRELEPLMRDVYAAYGDAMALRAALQRLLEFLTSDLGRTDANCSTTDAFISATEDLWRRLPEPLHGILDDMGGTLH